MHKERVGRGAPAQASVLETGASHHTPRDWRSCGARHLFSTHRTGRPISLLSHSSRTVAIGRNENGSLWSTCGSYFTTLSPVTLRNALANHVFYF
ncbi:hypothetical protein EVAR_100008_1 [Eumeta japonica]|uniref:Uncharacterized protein n=1 Tax=Eumeta variegata TaxID=151549 RepID=A0A4C1TIM0_EUMVA|nr:hypothetical protein EVAR_100008_1 [Eumeta japonica]